ncbi:MAG: phage tail protein [Alphaproteobacteria bacterium]|nr:phage tail protein [Alphaproteobacteria bacterium]
MATPAQESLPLIPFRFNVAFAETPLSGSKKGPVVICRGAFSECTGLEATMEPRIIREGGRNYGTILRVGRVSFATVVLKRGITDNRELAKWFQQVALGGYTYRLQVTITVQDASDTDKLSWVLQRAMPVKYKAADLNAAASGSVGVEELHLVHEGLHEVPVDGGAT